MKLHATLRTRLVALFLAAIAPLFGLALVKAWLNVDAAIKRATDNLTFSASLVAANQQRIVESAHQTLKVIANTPRLASAPASECSDYLKTLNAQLSIYLNLGLIDPDGYFRCDAKGNGRRVFVGDRDYFQSALAGNGGISVSRFMMGRGTGKPILAFALPIRDGSRKTTAVVFASINLEELSREIAHTSIPYAGRLAITDREGTLLAAFPPRPSQIGQPVPTPLLRDAVRTMSSGVQQGPDSNDRPRIFAYLPSGSPANASFFIAVSADRDVVVAPAYRQLGLELIVLTALALLGGCLAWFMAGRSIVRPTRRILDAAQQLQRGRFDVRIPLDSIKGGGELARIAADFNQMAESLQRQRDALTAELARSEAIQQRLQDAQRIGRIGYWQLNVETGESWWSKEAGDVLGVDTKRLESTPVGILTVIHPDDRDAFKTLRNETVGARLPLDTEFRVMTEAGEERWIHLAGKSHIETDANGNPTHRRSGVVHEITARKRAELALARTAELLNRTGEMGKIGGWEFLLGRKGFICSDEVYRLYEMEPVDFVPMEQAMERYLPEAQATFRTAMDACIDRGQPWDFVIQAVTVRGRRIRIRSQGKAILLDGKTIRVLGACQDVTEQHRAQEHLRLLESSIAHLNDMVLITEAEPLQAPGPRILFVNEAFERRTGYRREEVLGRSPRILQGPNTSQTELRRMSAALHQWQPYRGELINYTKSGEEFWLELDISPIADAKGWFTHWVAVERDVTQRKLAEQALMASEQRYAALFESAPVPMWVYDSVSFRFLTVNSAARNSYGYTADEFMSMTLFDIESESELDRLHKMLAEPTQIPGGIWWHRRKDGSVFPVDVVSRPTEYAERPARFVVAIDMTAQTRAEAEAREHLFTLQRAADAAQAITWHQTLQGTLDEFAEQARSVIGAHQSVVSLTTGDNWTQAIHAVSMSDKYAAYRDLSASPDGSGIYALVCQNNRPLRMTQAELESHPRWRGFGEHADKHPPMRGWLAVPLTGKDGKNIGLLQLSDRYEAEFTQQDEYIAVELAQLASIAIENARLLEEVSQLNAGLEQKVAERTVALARQEAFSRALAEEAPQVVWTADPKGRITFLNRAWFDIAGGTLADWAGTNWFDAVHPDDLVQIRAEWFDAMASRTPFVSTWRLRAKDGSYRAMSSRASPVLDARGEVVFWVGIDTDVTEMKAIETALRLSNQELEAFSYSVSHDLRSPLNTLDGFSRLLAKQLGGSGDEKVQHYLSRIQVAAAQMGQLIEDLLSLAQVSRAQLIKEQVDISALAHLIIEEWRVRQPDRNVLVEIEGGLQADGDARLIRVVMENLLGNAWKFTSRQSVARITVGCQQSGEESVFFVRDDGAGFDMAYVNKLFVPFQRLHAVTDFSGTGIGLATVSRVIRRHGGRVWAESSPLKGATFYFTLPGFAGV